MGRIAVIGLAANETNVNLVAALRAHGADARLLSPAQARRSLGAGDVALGRLDVSPRLDGTEPGVLDLLRLTARGVRVLNGARGLVNAHDKLRTYRRLAAAGIRTIPTQHVRTAVEVLLTPPVVLKPRFGSWGLDVLRCDTRAALELTFREIADRSWFRRHGVLVQPLLPPPGRDLRLVVAGNRIVGAKQRVSAPGEWRTNISLGGSYLAAVPDNAQAALGTAAARALGVDLAGVDLLPTSVGWVVVEVNGAVDFSNVYARPGRDIYEDVADALHLLPAAAHAIAPAS